MRNATQLSLVVLLIGVSVHTNVSRQTSVSRYLTAIHSASAGDDAPQSSFVRKVCFDATKSYMLIKLNDTWYHYCTVDRASFDNQPTVRR
jgi:hypothetical protein